MKERLVATRYRRMIIARPHPILTDKIAGVPRRDPIVRLVPNFPNRNRHWSRLSCFRRRSRFCISYCCSMEVGEPISHVVQPSFFNYHKKLSIRRWKETPAYCRAIHPLFTCPWWSICLGQTSDHLSTGPHIDLHWTKYKFHSHFSCSSPIFPQRLYHHYTRLCCIKSGGRRPIRLRTNCHLVV